MEDQEKLESGSNELDADRNRDVEEQGEKEPNDEDADRDHDVEGLEESKYREADMNRHVGCKGKDESKHGDAVKDQGSRRVNDWEVQGMSQPKEKVDGERNAEKPNEGYSEEEEVSEMEGLGCGRWPGG